MSENSEYENVFSGVLGENYQTIKLICPLAAKMSRLVGEAVKEYAQTHQQALNVVELGGGTGITTLSILLAADNLKVSSIDNAATMQQQAKVSLKKWVEQQRVDFIEADALVALKSMPDNSADIIASAYTLHNFLHEYREELVSEIYRVLKSGGKFINGDRHGLDDISEHTAMLQQEIASYFKVLKAENKIDLLEHWIVHLFADESENRVMRESIALNQLKQAGFSNVTLSQRIEVNALMSATKP
ncbi:MAG: methyltransferase domain-containing protein [Methylococcaceae bacterium]|nr:methyltransferase domain-containing protein [Methylococcaceae bacterium]